MILSASDELFFDFAELSIPGKAIIRIVRILYVCIGRSGLTAEASGHRAQQEG